MAKAIRLARVRGGFRLLPRRRPAAEVIEFPALPELKPRVPWWHYPVEAIERVATAVTWKPWVPLKEMPRRGWTAERAEWIAKSLIPFGKTLGLYEEPESYETPYEFGSSLIRAGLEAAGLKSTNPLVTAAGVIGGLALSLGTDPTMYLSVGARVAARSLARKGAIQTARRSTQILKVIKTKFRLAAAANQAARMVRLDRAYSRVARIRDGAKSLLESLRTVRKMPSTVVAAGVAGTRVRPAYQALRAVTFPIRAIGRVLSLPGRAVAPVTGFAAEQVARVPGLRVLAKPLYFARGVTAPFRGLRWMITKAAKHPGLPGKAAAHILKLGHKVKRLFVQHPLEQEIVRSVNADFYLFKTAANAIDDISLRNLRLWVENPNARRVTNLRAFLSIIGDNAADVAVKELQSRYGKDFGKVVMRMVEHPHLQWRLWRVLRKAGHPKQLSLGLVKPGKGPLSQNALDLVQNIVRDYRETLDDLLKQDELSYIAAQTAIPETVKLHIRSLLAQKPYLTKKDIKGVLAWIKAGRLGGARAVAQIPVALLSPRVRYAPHVYFAEEAVKRIADRIPGFWGKWGRNLRDQLVATTNLKKKVIKGLVARSIARLQKSAARVPVSRLEVSAHMAAEEINAAAWKAGLPEKYSLVSESAGFALATRGEKVLRKVAAREVTGLAVRAALLSPEGKKIFQSAARNKWLTPAKITDKAYGQVYRGYDGKGVPHIIEPTREFIQAYTGGKDVMFVKIAKGKWAAVPRDIGEVIANVNDILIGRQDVSVFVKHFADFYDRLSAHAKSLSLNYSFSYHVRNMLDDTVRMIVGEGVDAVGKGFDLASQIEAGATIRIPFADVIGDYTLGSARGELASAGKIGAMFRQEAPELVARQWNLPKRASLAAGIWGENFRAEALYLGTLDKYKHLTKASAQAKATAAVRDTLFAYQEITRFERMLPARVIFFYRFLRKSLAFHLRSMLEKPFREFLILRAAKLGYDPERPEWQLAPQWVLERGGRPLWQQAGDITYSTGLGLSAFDAIMKLTPGKFTQEWVGAGSPLWRAPLELVSGKMFFINRDISTRTSLFNRPFAAILSVFNPIAEKLTGLNLVHRRVFQGKEYWMVPGQVLWAMSQVRPLNDLRKVLDFVSNRTGNTGSLADAIFWVAAGTATTDINVREERLRRQVQDIQDAAEVLRRFGLMGRAPLYYRARGVEVSPGEMEQLQRVVGGLRALAMRRAIRPVRRGARRWRPIRLGAGRGTYGR